MKLSEWKSLEITQVIRAEIAKRQSWEKELLAEQAGLDPLADRLRVGAIKAYQDFLDIELDEETQE